MALFDSKKQNNKKQNKDLDVNNGDVKHKNLIDRSNGKKYAYHKNINADQETVNKLKAFVWTNKASNVKKAVDYAINEAVKSYPEATRKQYYEALSDINKLENAKNKYK